MRSPIAGPVASVLVVVLVVGCGWWAGQVRADTRPPLTSALDALPARTTVVGFTDWIRVRQALDLGTVDTTEEREQLTNESASRDLSTRSSLGGAIEEMHDVLGWSPADLEWEVYGQDPRGAATVARLSRAVSFDEVRSGLRKAGFEQDGEIWSATKQTGLPSILANVALVPRKRLVVISDVRRQVPLTLDVIGGRARSLAGVRPAADTAQAMAGSASLILQEGALGCDTTSMPDDADVEQQARTAVARAGGLEAYRYSGRGITDRGGSGFSAQRLVFAMTFESAAVASGQTGVRARLATGPFIGRIGAVEETLLLRSARSDGPTIRMAFAHDPETDVFMTGTGPVLFASC